MLIEVVVYPYLICTLLSGLGKLSPTIASELFKRSWIAYIFLLLLTFGTLLCLAQAIPVQTSGLVASSMTNAPSQTFLTLLIPDNIFTALSNNHVPAVVIFFTLFAVMTWRVKNAHILFPLLDMLADVCLELWRWLVKFAPYGVFALLAYTAGTIKLSQLMSLSEYLILFFFATLLLGFWIIPVTISTLISVPYRKVLLELRGALVISAATTLSVVALPYIQAVVHKLIKNSSSNEDTVNEVINATLSVSYPFAQIGNFFLYLFILFAAHYFNSPLTVSQQMLLPIATLLSSIGSPSTVINSAEFLTNWLHLPPETPELYISISPLMRYGQVLASVMGIAFMTIVTTLSYTNQIRIQLKTLLTHLLIAVAILVAVTVTIKNLIPDPDLEIYTRLNSAELNTDITKGIKPTLLPPFDETKLIPAQSSDDSLFRIQKTGVLRVGYNADLKPFVFFNTKNQLVGYDVTYIYDLARALHARIEFLPFSWQHLTDDLKADKFDIAIGGIYVTENRLGQVSFTEPYFKSPTSFIVPKNKQNEFRSANDIRAIKGLKIGVFNDPVLIPAVMKDFPQAQLVVLPNMTHALAPAFAQQKIDAAMWSQAQTDVWVLGHPQYASVVPTGLPAPFMMAYMLQSRSPQFLSFLNYWLDLKKNEGFQQEVFEHWILGRPMQDNTPRWSIIRNVLHWE